VRRTAGPLLAVLLGLVLLAPAARADGSASVSDTSVVPGQTVTVRASGLKPGGTANIDYLPDAVRLASVTVGADGGLVQDVQIPSLSKDGPKQIVVTAIAATGRYAYLATDMTLKGPAASARLSDTTLVPGQQLRVDGTRFLPGYAVSIVVFPEQQYLGQPDAGSDGRFSVDVRMPAQLLNGRHTIVVAGANASGSYSYLELSATVTGGRGNVPAGGGGGGGGSLPPLNPAVVPSSTTSTLRAPRPSATPLPPLGDGGDGGSRAGTVLLVVGFLALLALVAGTWFASPDGRRWRRERARQRRHRQRARRRRSAGSEG